MFLSINRSFFFTSRSVVWYYLWYFSCRKTFNISAIDWCLIFYFFLHFKEFRLVPWFIGWYLYYRNPILPSGIPLGPWTSPNLSLASLLCKILHSSLKICYIIVSSFKDTKFRYKLTILTSKDLQQQKIMVTGYKWLTS